mmetsp:Transcript_27320/g.89442  ORF Transcript_27320/g.89442 Transcript_27320/m.89442 type:complete len:216 (+) Transcript_27320:790-1437(+)
MINLVHEELLLEHVLLLCGFHEHHFREHLERVRGARRFVPHELDPAKLPLTYGAHHLEIVEFPLILLAPHRLALFDSRDEFAHDREEARHVVHEGVAMERQDDAWLGRDDGRGVRLAHAHEAALAEKLLRVHHAERHARASSDDVRLAALQDVETVGGRPFADDERSNLVRARLHNPSQSLERGSVEVGKKGHGSEEDHSVLGINLCRERVKVGS